MYGQPRTGISGWVYIVLATIVGLVSVGKLLTTKGKKLRVSESKGVVVIKKKDETTFLPRVAYHQN